jgi:hypothetical protein
MNRNSKNVIKSLFVCVLILTGCSAADWHTKKPTDQVISLSIEQPLSSKYYMLTDIAVHKLIKSYKIGKNTVKLYDAQCEGSPVYLFSAFNDFGINIGWFAYRKNNESDMKEFNHFKSLGEKEKSEYIRQTFLKMTDAADLAS